MNRAILVTYRSRDVELVHDFQGGGKEVVSGQTSASKGRKPKSGGKKSGQQLGLL